jgi:hypothetical protein
MIGHFCGRAGGRITRWAVSNSTEFAAQMMACNATSAFMLFSWVNGAFDMKQRHCRRLAPRRSVRVPCRAERHWAGLRCCVLASKA